MLMQLVALCVGVSKYARSPLHNPVKDAKDMAAQLQKRGIDTMMLADPDLTRMTMAINEFLVKARGAELAVCFFAGHGAYSKAAYKHILLVGYWQNYPQELGGFSRGVLYAVTCFLNMHPYRYYPGFTAGPLMGGPLRHVI